MKTLIKGSDLILNIKIDDMNNIPVRIGDTNYFSIKIYTQNEDNYIEASYENGTYKNIVVQPTIDQIYIESSDLEALENGPLCYTYEFAIANEHFEDNLYNEIQKGSTHIYLRN